MIQNFQMRELERLMHDCLGLVLRYECDGRDETRAIAGGRP